MKAVGIIMAIVILNSPSGQVPTGPSVTFAAGTLVVVVPTKDGVVIVADSRQTSRDSAGTASGTESVQKVYASIPGVAFAVTGNVVGMITKNGKPETVLDAAAVVRSVLKGKTSVSEATIHEAAETSRKAALRLHEARADEVERILRSPRQFQGVIIRGSPRPLAVGSFGINLTPSGAVAQDIAWSEILDGDEASPQLFGEGKATLAGLQTWQSAPAACARKFWIERGTAVRDLSAADAVRGALWIEEAATIGFGPNGSIGPPYAAFLLGKSLVSLPIKPAGPCK